jgi:hypothetical protein
MGGQDLEVGGGAEAVVVVAQPAAAAASPAGAVVARDAVGTAVRSIVVRVDHVRVNHW